MSKSDAMRAMREAKYARTSAAAPSRRGTAAAEEVSATTPATTPPKARQARTKPAPSEKTTPAPASPTAAAAPGEERCGHKSMNGRACTREAGHAEKSHRYS